MSRIALYPLKFKPVIKVKVWGGRRLASFGKQLPASDPVGESWELVDLSHDQSTVAGGSLAGIELHRLVESHHDQLMGPARLDAGRFPMLVKFIDAAQTLSVQVHPDDEVARLLGGRSKSEAWYILDAAPGAELYVGLRAGVARDDLERALDEDTILDLVQRIPARPGMLIPVRPGTIHAIGAGILLAEVQQPSDTTYRIHDWGRVGLSGAPRQLHLDQARESIHLRAAAAPLAEGAAVDMEKFQIDPLSLAAGEAFDLEGEGPAVVVCLAGDVAIAAGGHEELGLSRGEVTLIPHCCRAGARLRSTAGEARALSVTFPGGTR